MEAATAGFDEQQSETRSLKSAALGVAHQCVLAGVGAVGEAASLGKKAFDRLVRRGAQMEVQGASTLAAARGKAEERLGRIKAVAGARFEQTRAVAEAGIDDQLRQRLESVGVPNKDDLRAVVERLGAIEQRLESIQPAPKAPSRRTAKKSAKAE